MNQKERNKYLLDSSCKSTVVTSLVLETLELSIFGLFARQLCRNKKKEKKGKKGETCLCVNVLAIKVPGIHLLGHKEEAEIELFIREIDGIFEHFCGFSGNFRTKNGNPLWGHLDSPESNHYGVSVSINDLGVIFTAIGFAVSCFHEFLCHFDHLAAKRSHTSRNLEAWQLSNLSAREPVH